MAKKYLDDTGMSYFWGKLKAYFQKDMTAQEISDFVDSLDAGGAGTFIQEIKVLSVTVTKSNSNNVMLTATVPSGYTFLTWLGFGSSGVNDFTNCTYGYDSTTVKVWTGQTNSADVIGQYLVYR